eukprot:755994-Hanusia_phi.AAC.4
MRDSRSRASAEAAADPPGDRTVRSALPGRARCSKFKVRLSELSQRPSRTFRIEQASYTGPETWVPIPVR